MFQPIVPISGYAGWRFLEQTADAQKTALSESTAMLRQTDYFRNHIGSVKSPGDLVEDRQLLEVVLGAFGLSEDIDNRFFIRRILEDGPTNPEGLASRLSDTRYKDLASLLDFSKEKLDFSRSSFIEDIISRFEDEEFARAIGTQNEDFRLAMNVTTGIESVLSKSNSDEARWFSIMGSPPLRAVFETALGLPISFSQIDLDQQLDIFREKSKQKFGIGSIEEFSNPDIQDKIVRSFLVRSEATSSIKLSSEIALKLLSSIA